ncbi:MAG: SET domain-containing protein-lysine N-methyltransferase [Chromatiales bacterium]|nr:SET domain-containing protein-lysine N-methyltransferase [Chromatiales bacterium]
MKTRKSAPKKAVKPPNTYVARSGIHGRGLFAGEKIPRDTVIGTCEVQPARRNGAYVLWIEDEDGNEAGYRVLNAMRFINHSKRPNAVYLDDFTVVALRAIKPGDEITHDYGEAWT